MNKLFLFSLGVIMALGGVTVQAQTLMSSAWGEFENANISVTFTTGEVISGKFDSGTISLNSGFIPALDAISTPNDNSAPDLPTRFSLSQNYPNPFNPSTKIQFGLPQTSRVRLEVFNSIGARVAVLIDGDLGAGSHTVTFQANSFASGMYFYTLAANGRTISTKKMILIK